MDNEGAGGGGCRSGDCSGDKKKKAKKPKPTSCEFIDGVNPDLLRSPSVGAAVVRGDFGDIVAQNVLDLQRGGIGDNAQHFPGVIRRRWSKSRSSTCSPEGRG